jgi:hypothetical protein
MSSDNKVKIVKVFDNITLESTEDTTQADANRIIVDTYFSWKLNLVCKYTPGAAETTNTCDIMIYGHDGSDWVQIGEGTITGGVETFIPTIHRIAGATGGVDYEAHFKDEITFTKIKVTALEGGVATNKGKLTATVLVQ